MDFTNQASIKNYDLAMMCISKKKEDRKNSVFETICQMWDVNVSKTKCKEQIMELSRTFFRTFEKKWSDARRYRPSFLTRNAQWLEKNLIPANKSPKQPTPEVTFNQQGTSRLRGRPRISFEEASSKTKKRRVKELCATRTMDELQHAAQIISQHSLSTTKTIALWLDIDLSVRKYRLLRLVVNAIHKDFFPTEYAVNLAKNTFLEMQINASESSAEVDILQLLRATTRSILRLANLELVNSSQLQLTCKWGFDGSGGHSQYKQIFEDSGSTDEYMFLMAMVPLKLVVTSTGAEVWTNPRPGSTLYCRPIKFLYQKENARLVRREENAMRNKISSVESFDVTSWSDQQFVVKSEMLFTMIDGSTANILSDANATSNCIICGATPKQMNSQDVVTRPANAEHYRFGLSTLHCWIRFFECLLHIAYRLPVKTWQVRGDNKAVVEVNKKRIQAEFRAKMGLLVDYPKPGFGSTNDGNTARRFFAHPEVSSRITGVSKELITKFSIILRVLASGENIEVDKFKTLLANTRALYLKLYPWYYMPNSVHKVLTHGCEIIDSFYLPIGSLSEEALEATHKQIRKNRLSHTRKSSRIGGNSDLMKTLLLSSDPFLASERRTSSNKKVTIDNHVQFYLQNRQQSSTYSVPGFDVNVLHLGNSDDDDSS